MTRGRNTRGNTCVMAGRSLLPVNWASSLRQIKLYESAKWRVHDIANTCAATVKEKHHAEFHLARPTDGRSGYQRLCPAGLERQPPGGTELRCLVGLHERAPRRLPAESSANPIPRYSMPT